MSENPQSKLLSLLKTVRALPVDKQAQKKSYRLILKALLEIELSHPPTVTQNSSSTDERANPSVTSYLDKTLNELSIKEKELLNKNLAEFPVFNFMFIFVKSFFNYISEYHSIPYRLALLIEQVQLPFFRLTITQPKLVLDGNHPGFLLVNELIEYGPFWKDESKIGYPTFTKLSQLIDFSESNQKDLSEHFTKILQQVKSAKYNQQKRALIFEKRLKEKELGKAKITGANNVVNKIITQINELEGIPEIVSNIFDQAWRKLLALEYLRGDDKAFAKALALMKMLIISLQPIKNRASLNELFEKLPLVNSQLKSGFEKISFDSELAERFTSEVEAMHIALISESEKTISELDGLEETTKPKSASDEIIRLAPSDIFGEMQEQKELASTDEINDETTHLENPSPLEELFKHLEKDIKALTIDLAYEAKIGDIEPEVLELIEDSNDNPWFWSISEGNKSLHKLVLSIDDLGEHIFVNIEGNKSLSLTSDELTHQLKRKELFPLRKINIYQESKEQWQNKLKQYVSKITKDQTAKNAKTKEKLEDTPKPIAPQIDSELQQEKPKNLPKAENKTITNSAIKAVVKKVDVSSFVVGTWLKININQQPKRCKLAAKISSKDLYIFVDRQGKKICDLKITELNQKLTDGEIEVIDAELTNGKSLEAIISTNRSMKV